MLSGAELVDLLAPLPTKRAGPTDSRAAPPSFAFRSFFVRAVARRGKLKGVDVVRLGDLEVLQHSCTFTDKVFESGGIPM